MKKLFTLLTLVSLACMLTPTLSAQMKKPTKKAGTASQVTPGAAANVDSVTLTFPKVYDTAKVRIVVYSENSELFWFNGYMVKTYLKESATEGRDYGSPRYFNEKYEAIKPGDILFIGLYRW